MTDSAVAVLSASEVLSGLKTVQAVLAPDLNEDELKLFAMVSTRSGLDPFAKQIYAVKRKGRVTFQTGIDGYRSIAARTGMYDGQDEPEFGPVCGCAAEPKGHPEFATVRVYRKGVTRAIAATAHWHEYKPADNDFMWVRMPRVMIAKVAEALALRKAFPYDPERRHGIGADVYTADEMAQAESVAPVARPVPPTLAERAAAKRAELETHAESREATAEPSVVTDAATGREDEPADATKTGPSPADTAASLSPGSTELPSAQGLTSAAFMARIKAAGISSDQAGIVRLVMFPDASLPLTDEDRGQLLAQLLAEKDAAA